MYGLLFLAIVQIIVEVLPISSSGHMRIAGLLASRFGYSLPMQPHYFDEFLHTFTLVAMLIFFRHIWMPVLARLCAMVGSWWQKKPLRDSQKKLRLMVLHIAGYVLLCSLITIAGYLLIKAFNIDMLLDAQPVLLGAGFGLTGLLLVLTSLLPQETTLQQSKPMGITILIAMAQLGACLLPGVSRFASTVFMGRLLGVSIRRSLQWSWLIFMPLMAAAGLVHGVGAFVLHDHNWFVFQPGFLAGCGLVTIVSYGLFAGVLRLFQTGRSWLIGLYMLLPVLVLLFCTVKG